MSSTDPNPPTAGAGASATTTTAGMPLMDPSTRAVSYTCGDCDQDVELRRGEPIRCRNCGHRVLYKKRTNRMVQFEAR